MLIIGSGELSLPIASLSMKQYKEARRNKIIRDGKTLKPIFSDEHKLKLSIVHFGNKSALGHGVSEEARKAMSIGHIGKKASKETKQKMSIIHKGRILGPAPEDRKNKIRETVNAYYNKDLNNRFKGVRPMSEKNKHIAALRAAGNKNMLGKKHTQETKHRISKNKIGKPNGIIYTDALRKKMSDKAIALFQDPKYMIKRIESGHVYVSKPEHAFADILNSMEILYKRQHFIYDIQHRYPCDFYIEKYKMVIEIDGVYWHNFPHGKDIDHIRNLEMKNSGYVVLRFWEHEIHDIDIIKNKVYNVINNIKNRQETYDVK